MLFRVPIGFKRMADNRLLRSSVIHADQAYFRYPLTTFRLPCLFPVMTINGFYVLPSYVVFTRTGTNDTCGSKRHSVTDDFRHLYATPAAHHVITPKTIRGPFKASAATRAFPDELIPSEA